VFPASPTIQAEEESEVESHAKTTSYPNPVDREVAEFRYQFLPLITFCVIVAVRGRYVAVLRDSAQRAGSS